MSFSTGTLLQQIPYMYTSSVPTYNTNLFIDSGYHIGEWFWDIRNYVLSKWYKEGTWALYLVSSDTLVGSWYLNLQDTNGKIYQPMVIQSTGTIRAETTLPKYAFIRSWISIYNGLFWIFTLAPGAITWLSNIKWALWYTIPWLYLTNFSWNPLTTTISIGKIS